MFSLIHASARLTSTMWSGQVCRGTDAVVDRHAHPTAVGHVAQQRISLGLPHADGPGAAGHLQEHRCLAVTGQVGASPDVGEVHLGMRAVLHGAGLFDIPPTDQLVGKHTDPGATAPRRLRPVGDLLVVVTQGFAQRLLEMRLRRDVAAMDQPQQSPRHRCEQQRDSSTSAAEVATQAAAQRVEHRDAHVHRRHLRRRPAEREHRNGDVALAGDGLHAVGGVDEFCDRAQQRVATFTHGRP